VRFTDGFWQPRADVTPLLARQVHDIWGDSEALQVFAPTAPVAHRSDTLNRPLLTVTISSPMENVIRVRVDHFQGGAEKVRFGMPGAERGVAEVTVEDARGVLRSGALTATVLKGDAWSLSFDASGRHLTSSGSKSLGYMMLDNGERYVHEQLDLGVGELVYGLGERFGPVVKNGQSIDIWNADGGTSSYQAYKNVPFYLTNRGYGVLVDNPGRVSFEVGSESVERVQFSVAGESLEYLILYGPTPKEVLDRYTALTGRPARVPAWSYGLWLSTSFTTDYDEGTVTSFIDGMAERNLPLSTVHFDCFWMREFNWCDFAWDPRTFPDPEAMLSRLHQRGLHVCVWINPYIAQRSPLFAEGRAAGYLLTTPGGDVWQWDMWQAGMALVDFTNPDAVAWFQGKLRRLLDMGVDTFKTDFGERVPTDVVYHDGSDPERMHNLYTLLYNRAVFDLLEDSRGQGEAVLFARSATVGGQSLPVHWGGDSTSSYASMAETLRGGLSLAMSGFAFWSHDIGGFEGLPDAGVFKRWTAFGLLSSHSRFHGSTSYRVPWIFDEEAVEVTRRFTTLKLRLMPYLYAAGIEASQTGIPVMRPMQLEFPDDPAVGYLDRQYLLGADLLVAPVFSPDGTVDVYLPAGIWTNYVTGESVPGPCWRSETHGYLTLPLYVRDGAVLPHGDVDDRPDYDYLDGLTLQVYPSSEPAASERTVTVTTPDGTTAEFRVQRQDRRVVVTSTTTSPFVVRLVGGQSVQATDGAAELTW
jgi:alpha-D-xyloside xylohydrolase